MRNYCTALSRPDSHPSVVHIESTRHKGSFLYVTSVQIQAGMPGVAHYNLDAQQDMSISCAQSLH